MNVRNCTDIGVNAQYIVKRLLANQNLLKLLYYTDKDPLSHEDLTQEQIQNEIFEKLVKIVPRVGPKETAHSIIAVRIARATTKRDVVAICGYHGWSDWYIAANLGGEDKLDGQTAF